MSKMYPKSQDPADLVKAFENGDMHIYYQPKVDVHRPWPVIIGYEALSRWLLSDGRFVMPDDFIPVAEGCGLVKAIDSWVIGTVCEELARSSLDSGTRSLGMAANVSAKQFGERDFAQSVGDILTRTGVDPACLTLEITERAVLEEDATTLGNIHALREMGVSLALDDFGTGYSSLFHLSSLPIQEIKLDRSFVAGVPHRHRDAAILAATINLALDLGLRVVAEGVELAQQAEWLRSHGCRSIQGFLYGRPAPRCHQVVK